ncbi:MAG: nuclear transport factor 2 family protein [Pseudomonadota bacterium]
MLRNLWGVLVTVTMLAASASAHAQSWQGTGEMPLDYHAYVRDFNSGDDRGLIEKYFTPDTQMISGSGVRKGHKEMNEFLAAAHDGVREIIRPQVVMWDKDHIFAEIDMDFIASKPRPDFVFGALQPGDILTVKFFAHYTVVNGKIKTLKTMTWKPETGVTKAPRLGAEAGQRAAFIAYTRAFSGGLPAKYSAFYTNDVKLQLSSVGQLSGKQAIVDFYTKMFKTVREDLVINQIVYDNNAIVGDFVSVFTAVEDAPDFVVAPLKKGESVRVPVFVYYTLRDGLICEIRVARSGQLAKGMK